MKKNIVLLDNSCEGHHLSFMNMFVEILVKLNYNVIVFFPNQELVRKYLKTKITEDELKSISFNEYIEPTFNYKIWNRVNDAINIFSKWRYVNKVLKQYESKTNVKIDLVFFAMLDGYMSNYLHGKIVDSFFEYKWTGLFFHPKHMRYDTSFWNKKTSLSDIDITLLAKNCIGFSVHDFGIVEAYKKRTNKNVVFFAETADDTPPDIHCTIANDIKLKAKGRTVVGMVGLEWHKGGYTLYQLSQIAPKDEFYFVFIGIRPESGYSKKQLADLNQFYSKEHENCFFYFKPLKEGAEYNAVFCALDIPFLVYNNFASTSNRLTKAAIFEKPVLAANKYCIAEDINKYSLGELVPEGDANACLESIIKLKIDIEAGKYLNYSNFETYRSINSVDSLSNQFKELLGI